MEEYLSTACSALPKGGMLVRRYLPKVRGLVLSFGLDGYDYSGKHLFGSLPRHGGRVRADYNR